MIKAMHHTGFVVKDIEKSVAFYRDVVGLQVVDRFQRVGDAIDQVVGYKSAKLEICTLKAEGDHILELIEYVNPPSGPRLTEERSVLGGTHLCMHVSDIDETFKKFTSNGAIKMNPPAELVKGRKACYLQDPDHNWIELLELAT